MTVYVANLSKNVLEFTYRVAGENRYFVTKILPFTQESVYPGGTSDEHKDIVEQNRRYGLVAVSEIGGTKGFIGMCYQFDKPIHPSKMLPVAAHNDEALVEAAHESRKVAALVAGDILAKQAQETGMKFNGVSVDLEEQDSRDKDGEINERLVVEPTGRRRRHK